MGLTIAQITIDDSSDKTITGRLEWDRANGGILIPPSGSSFPASPQDGEEFWRTDEAVLYRYNGATWDALTAVDAVHRARTDNPHSTTASQVGAPPTSRQIATSSGLQGGGDLSADRTLSPVYGSAVNTVCQGNDSRLSDARTPLSHASTHKGDGADAIAVATQTVAGLESAADKTKLDGIASGATNTPLTSTAPVNVTKAAAAVGTSSEAARQDHKHDITTATAGAATPGDSAAEGSATSLARSDHQHSLPAFGSGVGTFCQGNDARLSDDRTASGLRTATTVVAISGAAAPTAGQVLQASGPSAAAWATPAAAAVFGQDWQTAADEGESTTTSTSFQDKLSMTTPALTGTYRVAFYCEISPSTANRLQEARLYNSTNATELCIGITRPSATSVYMPIYGFQLVTFSGAAKTFLVQYRSPQGVTVAIRRARMELWRVS